MADDDIERAADQARAVLDESAFALAIEAGVAAMMDAVKKYPVTPQDPRMAGAIGWGLDVREALRLGLRAAALWEAATVAGLMDDVMRLTVEVERLRAREDELTVQSVDLAAKIVGQAPATPEMPMSQDCRDGVHGGGCVGCRCDCHGPAPATPDEGDEDLPPLTSLIGSMPGLRAELAAEQDPNLRSLTQLIEQQQEALDETSAALAAAGAERVRYAAAARRAIALVRELQSNDGEYTDPMMLSGQILDLIVSALSVEAGEQR